MDNALVANSEHLAIFNRGRAAWNDWRESNPDIQPDLRGADFRDAKFRAVELGRSQLRRTHFSGASLHRGNLSNADCDEADFRSADLSEANLRGAYFGFADLHKANLSGADLAGANLNWATLTEANLSGANFSGADFSRIELGWTIFGNNDLSDVKGLETARHLGPSIVGIDIFYKSGGKIPEIFLRGAGVPATFITYMKSLGANLVEFYSCFISYSTKDQDFADRLCADLQTKGVRCWFAPHDIAGGKKIHEQIDEAIRRYDRLLLILSPASMASEWVRAEIAKARNRETKEQRRVLFPVRLSDFESLRDWELFDSDTGKDSAREIREYFIPDFSQWKDHDLYQRAFDRLLRDLKAEAEKSN